MSRHSLMRSYEAPEWAKKNLPAEHIPTEKLELAMMPTPIRDWSMPGVPEGFKVMIKRDDMTGSSLSGNKVRKLEFLLADALNKGCKHIITCGSIQSNHSRATAIASAELGLKCHLFLRTSITNLLRDLTSYYFSTMMPRYATRNARLRFEADLESSAGNRRRKLVKRRLESQAKRSTRVEMARLAEPEPVSDVLAVMDVPTDETTMLDGAGDGQMEEMECEQDMNMALDMCDEEYNGEVGVTEPIGAGLVDDRTTDESDGEEFVDYGSTIDATIDSVIYGRGDGDSEEEKRVRPNQKRARIASTDSETETETKTGVGRRNRANENCYRGEQSKRNAQKKKRDMRDPCQCRLHCYQKFTVERRRVIYDGFWDLVEQRARDLWVFNLVDRSSPTQHRPRVKDSGKERSVTLTYHLQRSDAEPKVKVCKEMFFGTIGYSKHSSFVNTMMNRTEEDAPVPGKRMVGGVLGETLYDHDEIQQHIRSYRPALPHHRRAHAPNRLYLPPSLTVADMYQEYQQMSKNPAGMRTYENVLRKDLNISFCRIKGLECGKCLVLGGPDLDAHKRAAYAAATSYRRDRDKVRDGQVGNHVYLSVDMQKIVLLPHMPRYKESVFESRLVTFHLTAAPLFSLSDLAPTYAMTWHEAVKGRTGSDIASAYINLLLANRDAERVVIWCDNCVAQNKNYFLFRSLVHMVNSHSIAASRITLKFLETGHTSMSADTFHAAVEKRISKVGNVLDWDDWKSVLNTALSKPKHPVQVIDMTADKFYSIQKLNRSNLKNYRPFNVEDASLIQVRRGSRSIFMSKKHSPCSWREFDFLNSQVNVSTMPRKNTGGPRGVNSQKAKSIVDNLCPVMVGMRKDEADIKFEGNLLLDRLVGANLYLMEKEASYITQLNQTRIAMDNLAKKIKEETGEGAYPIPVGGSTPLGNWGYLAAFEEIRNQGVEFDDLVLACGSGATAAGLAIANYLCGSPYKIHSVLVCEKAMVFHEYVDDSLKAYGLADKVKSEDIVLMHEECQHPGYDMNTPEQLDFIARASQKTGIMLDNCYTGKAAYGLQQLLQNKPEIFKGRRILFLHSGGIYSLQCENVKSRMLPSVTEATINMIPKN